MRQTPNVLYIAVDGLIPVHGKSFPGLDEFTAALDHAGVPAVWLTSRSRLQFDDARRKNAHTHPFIAESGCCVYMPEDYFHLRPEKTVRLGRFTCIPIAEKVPAAAQALEALSEDTRVPVVPLRSLSPRELAQNTGLPQREAELARQRDFDELFFFAGASDADVQRFILKAREQKLQLRQHNVIWSLAIGANVGRGIRELAKLYDRALRYHPTTLGVATANEAEYLFPYCDRSILLSDRRAKAGETQGQVAPRPEFPLHSPEMWELLLESIISKI